MKKTRIKGLGAPEKSDRHLAELEREAPAEDPVRVSARDDGFGSAREEIMALREEIGDLRERLAAIRTQTEGVPPRAEEQNSWLRIGATIAATFLLGKLVQRLRLGAAGAAAVPLIAAQINRRVW